VFYDVLFCLLVLSACAEDRENHYSSFLKGSIPHLGPTHSLFLSFLCVWRDTVRRFLDFFFPFFFSSLSLAMSDGLPLLGGLCSPLDLQPRFYFNFFSQRRFFFPLLPFFSILVTVGLDLYSFFSVVERAFAATHPWNHPFFDKPFQGEQWPISCTSLLPFLPSGPFFPLLFAIRLHGRCFDLL